MNKTAGIWRAILRRMYLMCYSGRLFIKVFETYFKELIGFLKKKLEKTF